MLSPLLSLVSPCLGVRDFVALPLLAPPAFPPFFPPLYDHETWPELLIQLLCTAWGGTDA